MLIALTLGLVNINAEIDNDINGYRFLNIENSAGIFSMGNAGVAQPSGLNSIQYNPASLAYIHKFEFLASYRTLFRSINPIVDISRSR